MNKAGIVPLVVLLALLPLALALQAEPLSDAAVTLNWEKDAPAWKYVIFRDGHLIGYTHTSVYTYGNEQPQPPLTTYTDHFLAPDTRYEYEVRAVYQYNNDNTNDRDETSLGTVTVTTLPYQGAAHLINPHTDLEYLGAFKLPEGNEVFDAGGKRTSGSNWGYSGDGMTYNPRGDPSNTDNFPGSLLGIGHAQTFFHVSEISIPEPVNSRNLADLPTATTLQPFTDIGVEVPERGGGWHKGDIAYVPDPQNHANDKIYYAWKSIYTHIKTSTFGRANLQGLTHKEGQWVIGKIDGAPHFLYYGRFLFTVPQEWADKYTKGMNIITGSYQSGGGAVLGHSLYALDLPLPQEDAPPDRSELDYVPILEYGPLEYYYTTDYKYDAEFYPNSVHHFNKASFWEGADWVSSGDKSAIVLSGSQAYGLEWYGFDDGTIYYPEKHQQNKEIYSSKGEKGHRATETRGLFLFFDPEELGKVALGEIPSWQPQPYAVLEFNPYAYRTTGGSARNDLGAMAFDRVQGYLYAFEPKGESGETICDESSGKCKTETDSRKSIVQVWKLNDVRPEEGDLSQEDDTLDREELPPPAPLCGNSIRQENEACDDGNKVNGDGCSADCRIEASPPEAFVKEVQPALEEYESVREQCQDDACRDESTKTFLEIIRELIKRFFAAWG